MDVFSINTDTKTGAGRRAILERARQERQHRAEQRNREQAALLLQSVARARSGRRHASAVASHRLEQHFKATPDEDDRGQVLISLAAFLSPPSPSTSSAGKQWSQLLKVCSLLVKHDCIAAQSPDLVWVLRMRKLSCLLLRHLVYRALDQGLEQREQQASLALVLKTVHLVHERAMSSDCRDGHRELLVAYQAQRSMADMTRVLLQRVVQQCPMFSSLVLAMWVSLWERGAPVSSAVHQLQVQLLDSVLSVPGMEAGLSKLCRTRATLLTRVCRVVVLQLDQKQQLMGESATRVLFHLSSVARDGMKRCSGDDAVVVSWALATLLWRCDTDVLCRGVDAGEAWPVYDATFWAQLLCRVLGYNQSFVFSPLQRAQLSDRSLDPSRVACCVALCRAWLCCTRNQERCAWVLLNGVCFSTPLMLCLWRCVCDAVEVHDLSDASAASKWRTLLLSSGAAAVKVQRMFLVFAKMYAHVLIVLEEDEFRKQKSPFDIDAATALACLLKDIMFHFIFYAHVSTGQLVEACMALLKQLRMRSVRGEMGEEDMWLLGAQQYQDWQESFNDALDSRRAPALQVLHTLPFCIPFRRRVEVFRNFVQSDRRVAHATQHRILVRRSHLVQDGFEAVNRLGRRFRGKIVCAFAQEEQAMDLGGVFKEFMELICREVFSHRYGMFVNTPSGRIYPNPTPLPDQLEVMEFMGRVLGKALYEGILVEVPFASFFLRKLLGQAVSLSDMRHLDVDLHKNLLFLKHYEGDAEDLALDFTISRGGFGSCDTVPLVPNGAKLGVTNENKIKYIYLVCDYRLNRSIQRACEAFAVGFFDIVDRNWLDMFDERELQLLVCGADATIDVDDWRRNCSYEQPFHDGHRVVRWFWRSVQGMSSEERKALMCFVTSSSRPPLMGFQYLTPAFTVRPAVRREGGGSSLSLFSRLFSRRTNALLPTASTCFNVLKLPVYNSFSELDDKLRTAVQTGSTGFGLI